MTGRELRYQQGFDCQGLWVEVEVEKELQLKSKRDIENLVPGDPEASVARFVQALQRPGATSTPPSRPSSRSAWATGWTGTRPTPTGPRRPDERKSYFTMSDANNYTIWDFLKKCHNKGLALPWLRRDALVRPVLRASRKWSRKKAID